MKNIDITVENATERTFPHEEELKNDVTGIFKNLVEFDDVKSQYTLKDKNFDTISFDIVLCDDKIIHEINRDYRNIDRPTDVITFAVFADSPEDEKFVLNNEINLGEIIISVETVTRQAKENSNSDKKELYTVAAHGMLHLLGFDHQTEDDYNFVVKTQNAAVKDYV